MTEKEKAKDLIESFTGYEFFDTPLYVHGVLEFLPYSIAKHCALICCEEIIKENQIIDKDFTPDHDTLGRLAERHEYWQAVKKELIK